MLRYFADQRVVDIGNDKIVQVRQTSADGIGRYSDLHLFFILICQKCD